MYLSGKCFYPKIAFVCVHTQLLNKSRYHGDHHGELAAWRTADMQNVLK